MKLPGSFTADAAKMGVTLDAAALLQFAQLGATLIDWNQRLNLTAIDDPPRIVTHHFLDSLIAATRLQGTNIADAGTGAGFPGLPLAIARPDLRFMLIDATLKKLRFVDHVVEALGLKNVTTLHARIEQLSPPAPFDTVIARAFAPLPRLARWIAPLCGARTRIIAMKGRWPETPPLNASAETRNQADEPLPKGWTIVDVARVEVPGLDAERHLVQLAFSPRG